MHPQILDTGLAQYALEHPARAFDPQHPIIQAATWQRADDFQRWLRQVYASHVAGLIGFMLGQFNYVATNI